MSNKYRKCLAYILTCYMLTNLFKQKIDIFVPCIEKVIIFFNVLECVLYKPGAPGISFSLSLYIRLHLKKSSLYAYISEKGVYM
jgi:hypothetical protein